MARARRSAARTRVATSLSITPAKLGELVKSYLLRELPDSTEADETASVTLQTSKGVIASRLNLTQEHFSRILHELAEAGLLQVQGRRIVVRDTHRFRQATTPR